MRASFLSALPGALAGFAWLAACCAAAAAGTPAASSLPPSVAAPAQGQRPAPVRVAQAKVEARPTWSEMSPARRQALAPLTGTWSTLTEAHKRKWLVVADSFARMPPAEQARLHTRMAEWAALSPQQRVQARQNYFAIQQVPESDKKAKWEAYQALPPEEKKKLAAGAAKAKPVTPATAAAVQPVPQQKLARVPKAKPNDSRAPRIAVAPAKVQDLDSQVPPGTPAVLP